MAKQNKADHNWRSYVGPEDNGRTITADEWSNPPDPENWDDLFKCSNVQGLTAFGLSIPAAREDSFDAVRGSGYAVIGCLLGGSVTVKGAIDGARFEGCVIDGLVELGQYDNYWKPGRAPTKGVKLIACTSSEGEPIVVRCWDAEPPLVTDTSVKVKRVPWLIWFSYFLWRRLTNPRAVK
jgi:hypothetical protein